MLESDPSEPSPCLLDDSSFQRIRLVRGGALFLEADGFRLVEPRGLKRSPTHAYESISHVYVTDRILLVGTKDSLLSVRSEDFAEAEYAATYAKDRLLARVAALPNAADAEARMAAVDRLGDREGPTWMIWATIFLCLLGTGYQLYDPMVEQVGSFIPDLFARGEYWRAISMHFLHALSTMPGPLQGLLPSFPFVPFHLMVNMGGLLVLGHLVERPLGSWRTAIVMVLSGLGTIVGILAYGHQEVIGASGIVSGLAGAMLAMELHYGASLPAFWRLPRRIFMMVLVVQFGVIDLAMSSFVAGGAHLGGFGGGYVAAWLLGRPSELSLVPNANLRFSVGCAAILIGVGCLGGVPLAQHEMSALERHARRLYDVPEAAYLFRQDNGVAWLIATEEGASTEGLDLAVSLADRAVRNTGGVFPGILDTLAEALFQRGDWIAAIFTIEEAIALSPGEPYYFEQRRRFLGERDPADRPPPPGAIPPGVLPPDIDPDDFPIKPEAVRVVI